jgi:hypothetical protein
MSEVSWQSCTVRLIELAGDGHVEELSCRIAELTAPGPGQRARLHGVLTELTRVCAKAVVANAGLANLADRPDPQTVMHVVVYDLDGAAVNVDDITPPVRALLRALLAELSNHPTDAAMQLDIALDNAVELEILFAYALAWVIELTDWSGAPYHG